YGDADFNVSASASSGLAVTWSTSGSCTNTGSTIHLIAGGSCTVTASQGGNGNYNAATSVNRTFSIAKRATTLSIACTDTCGGSITYGSQQTFVATIHTTGSGVTPGSTVELFRDGVDVADSDLAANGTVTF